MNLWFRLFRILLSGMLAKKVNWFEPTQVAFRVWPTDLDINLHLTNSRYMALMDLARVDMLARTGLWRWIRERKLAPVVASAMVRFRRPIAPFARFTIMTRFIGWDTKWLFIEHRVECKGELVCLTAVKTAFLGKTGPIAPNDIVRDFGHTEVRKPLPDWIATWQAAEYAASQNGDKA